MPVVATPLDSTPLNSPSPKMPGITSPDQSALTLLSSSGLAIVTGISSPLKPRDRAALIVSFEKLAIHFAKKHRGKGLEFADLFQSAMMAVTAAVDSFDPARSVPFHTYVSLCIGYELGHEVRRAANRVPTSGSRMLEANEPAIPHDDQYDDGSYDYLYDAVDQLPPADRSILTELYGLDGHPPRTLRAAGYNAGRSQVTIHRSKHRSLTSLRAALTA